MLEPYIQAGLVHLIPDPGDFNPQFRMSALQMAAQRTAGWTPSRKSVGWMEALAEDDCLRLMRQLPDDLHESLMRKRTPEASAAQVNADIEYIKSEVAADPLALLQPIEPGEAGAQFLYLKGYNVESAMYLASLTGSSIYTDVQAHWQQLHMYALPGDRAPNSAWNPVVESLGAVSFPIEMNANTLLEALQAGRFGSIRPVLRRFGEAVQQSGTAPPAHQISLQFNEAALGVQREWADVPSALRLVGHIELSVPLDEAATAADDRPPHTFLAATPLWRLRFSPRRVPP